MLSAVVADAVLGAVPLLSARITQTVRLYAEGAELIGPVHHDRGY